MAKLNFQFNASLLNKNINFFKKKKNLKKPKPLNGSVYTVILIVNGLIY